MTASDIHNGFYTLKSTENGLHRTFRIKTQRKGKLEGKRILGLLTGPDNESDYESFAFVDDQRINVWKSKRGGTAHHWKLASGEWQEGTAFEWYAVLLKSLILEEDKSPWASKYEMNLDGRCVRCNRRLTTPESVAAGIGPECATKGV